MAVYLSLASRGTGLVKPFLVVMVNLPVIGSLNMDHGNAVGSLIGLSKVKLLLPQRMGFAKDHLPWGAWGPTSGADGTSRASKAGTAPDESLAKLQAQLEC